MRLILFFALGFAFQSPAEDLWGENLMSDTLWKEKKAFPQIKSRFLLAQDNSNKTFDPFIDYGEFQDNVAEEESLSFFQHGRSLSVILMAGYEGVTFNMRQIYGDSLFFVGLNISFFIDFHIAFQLSGMLPTGHYNSLFNSNWPFFHYGLDMKYYWHKQYVNEEQKMFNPYLIAGPFVFNMIGRTPLESQNNQIPIVTNPTEPAGAVSPAGLDLTREERDAVPIITNIGLKTGLGLELNVLDPIFISFEAVHLYVHFKGFENTDLSMYETPPLPQPQANPDILYWLQYPNRPEVRGYKFYGDLFQITVQAGINF